MDGPVSTLLIFGATGDLARRMLLPSLYGLHADGLLPKGMAILATARSELDDEGFRNLAREALEEHLPEDFFAEDVAKTFADRLSYVPLDISDRAGFERLAKKVGKGEGLAVFLSTSPKLFQTVIAGLDSAGLTGDHVRIALEKPLGSDLSSSRDINDCVAAAFPEERIFRFDHYLGKETVQNLLALRFANAIFEPLWSSAHVEHVQITVAETVGLEGRGDYYDGAGALRDMVQNHMLQLLALVAMEPPAEFDATEVRDEKVKVLRALRPMSPKTVREELVLGQFADGQVQGEHAEGYADELGRPSGTETFASIIAHVDNWRWGGVPFYLRTGKRLPVRKTEILVQFKPVPYSIFAARGATTRANRLIISIQPEENIRLAIMAKTPGLDRQGIRLREVTLDVGRSDAFADHRRRIAYERLLIDLIEGRQTLFVRRDEVEAQWRWIDGIRQAMEQAGMNAEAYPAGTRGPPSAERLIERHGVHWND